jgi:hypothetical protein
MLFEEKETTNEHELLSQNICYLYAKQWNRTRSYRLVAGTYTQISICKALLQTGFSEV